MTASIVGAYCLGGYTIDTTSTRYLIPLFATLVPLMARWLTGVPDRLARSLGIRGVAWVLAGLACTVHLADARQMLRNDGFLSEPGLAILRPESPPRSVASYLLARNMTAAYGTYWIGYHLTFLTNEELVVAPYHGIDERKPPDYAPIVRHHPNPAYIFLGTDRERRHAFEATLRRRAIAYHVEKFSGFLLGIYVYHSASGSFPHDL